MNKKEKVEHSYSCEQLRVAQEVCNKKYDRKRIWMGIVGGIVSIACPVGAIMAFYEWPLLQFFFTMLIPGAGPLLGAIAAVVAGGLLFWSIYHKADRKFGSYAKEALDIKTKLSMVKRLEAELIEVDQKLENSYQNRRNLEEKRSEIYRTIQRLCPYSANDIVPNYHLEPSDAATTRDGVGAFLTASAGFLCAFSGMLGILGGVSTYLPTVMALTIVVGGIPIAGWCALALSLAVGIVGAMVYRAKFDNSLAECGEARRKLEDKKICLYQETQAFVQRAQTRSHVNRSSNRTLLDCEPVERVRVQNLEDKPPVARFLAFLGLHRIEHNLYENQDNLVLQKSINKR